jgi:alpha-tubulin suppressor-like RCC1 family protein
MRVTVLFLLVVSVLNGCKNASGGGAGVSSGSTWTAEQLSAANNNCALSARDSYPNISFMQASAVCSCLFKTAQTRWTFEEFLPNEATHTKKLQDDGTMAECAKSEVNQSASSGALGKYSGSWRSDCLPTTGADSSIRSAQVILHFNGSSLVKEFRDYRGPNCLELSNKVLHNFGIKDDGNAAGIEADKLNLTRRETILRYFHAGDALLAGQLGLYNFNDWALGVEHNINNRSSDINVTPQFLLDQMTFDISKISGSRLYLGDLSTNLNGTTPAKRPDKLDFSFGFNYLWEPNLAPVFMSSVNQSLVLGQAANFYATDPDGDSLIARCIENCPPGISISGSTISWTPSQEGDFWQVTIEVSDGKSNSTRSFNIEVFKQYQVYRDIDGDGFGTGALAIKNSKGGFPVGYSVNGTDCDDASTSKWQMKSYTHRDIDGHGYSSPSSGSICTGAALPDGYSTQSFGSDCDPSDPNKWQLISYSGTDLDGDGLTVPMNSAICTGSTLPIGYTNLLSTEIDYNDRLNELIDAGERFACKVNSEGGVICWGDNYYGQLGIDGLQNSFTPMLVPGISGATQISLGEQHACTRTNTGEVYCWGSGGFAKLGNGINGGSRKPPTKVLNISDAIKVAAGYSHTCALLSNGLVKCWGNNSSGQVGIGPGSTTVLNPTLVPSIADILDVQAGVDHTCALTKSGSLYCWGGNLFGQIGDGTAENRALPTLVTNASPAIAIQTGIHTCAILSNKSVKCWGVNQSGQIGIDSNYLSATSGVLIPASISGITDAQVLGAGGSNTCAGLSGGAIKCWGGRMGNASSNSTYTPLNVTGLSDIVSLTMGSGFGCALARTGSTKCWGWNDIGQLGAGLNQQYTLDPTEISP